MLAIVTLRWHPPRGMKATTPPEKSRVYTLDPLTDPRWEDLMDRHQDAGMFHTPAWLLALRSTYGYEPIVYTHSADGEALRDGIVFCSVRSLLTGKRLVSLPFSDFCQPLLEVGKEPSLLGDLLEQAARDGRQHRSRYVEVRPGKAVDVPGYAPHAVFFWHRIDLRPAIDEIQARFHKNHVRRKIVRAEKEGLRYEVGSSDELVSRFYRLFMFNRRKYGIPPQPIAWYRNLLGNFKKHMKIHLAYKEERPIAAIITFDHARTCYYKYGCADPAYTNTGSNALLFWSAMRSARERGLEWFDLGRSDVDASGFRLAQSKENWGAIRNSLVYWRAETSQCSPRGSIAPELPEAPMEHGHGPVGRMARLLFARLPDSLLVLSGRLLYRHVG